jgi:hypothetical protein
VSLIRLETFAAFKFVLKPFRGKFHCWSCDWISKS